MTAPYARPFSNDLHTLTDGAVLLFSRLENEAWVKEDLVRLELDIEPLSLCGFLSAAANLNLERCFFETRDHSLAIAGIGHAVCLQADSQEQIGQLMSEAQQRVLSTEAAWIGGMAYDSGEVWQDFPLAQFSIPLLEVRKHRDHYQLIFNLFAQNVDEWNCQRNTLRYIVDHLLLSNKVKPQYFDVIHCYSDFDFIHWQNLVAKALLEIKAGEFEKVVLARKVSLVFSAPPDIFQALDSQENHFGYKFALEKNGKIFFGCSPERLYQKRQQFFSSEALAGTVERGQNIIDDGRLAECLIKNPKLIAEHQCVAKAIEQAIKPLAMHMAELPKVEVIKLNSVQHGYQPLNAVLMPEVSDGQIFVLLHPTPATCGYPRQAAASFIQQHESTNRGWYAGAVGIITRDITELAVSIRSGLCENSQVSLYSGVGIVEGSDPQEEWRELESKLASWFQVFGVAKTSSAL